MNEQQKTMSNQLQALIVQQKIMNEQLKEMKLQQQIMDKRIGKIETKLIQLNSWVDYMYLELESRKMVVPRFNYVNYSPANH